MSYTPGLLVTPSTRHRVRRLLPIPGDVLVEVGQSVAATEVVARTARPGEVDPVNLKSRLGVAPADVPRCLLKEVGQSVAAGEVVARSPGLWGFFRREYAAERPGTIESVSRITGQMILRGPEQAIELPAYLSGHVVEVVPGQGCVIEAAAAVVQGIFGIGGEAHGPLRMAATDPGQTLRSVPADSRGQVLVGGARVTIEAIREAIGHGAAAIIAGGIDDADLKDLLGYDLGVAITGTETIGLTLVITEGFGEIAMAARTFELLGSLAGREASVNGTTQIRAGVLRPEVLVPVDGDSAPPRPAAALAVGVPVRIIRDPHFGTLGQVAALPPEPAMLESQSRARVLVVDTAAGPLTVPRANVELIET